MLIYNEDGQPAMLYQLAGFKPGVVGVRQLFAIRARVHGSYNT